MSRTRQTGRQYPDRQAESRSAARRRCGLVARNRRRADQWRNAAGGCHQAERHGPRSHHRVAVVRDPGGLNSQTGQATALVLPTNDPLRIQLHAAGLARVALQLRQGLAARSDFRRWFSEQLRKPANVGHPVPDLPHAGSKGPGTGHRKRTEAGPGVLGSFDEGRLGRYVGQAKETTRNNQKQAQG